MSGSDFLPPDEMTLQLAGETLSSRINVAERGSSEVDRTYYDTFDGLAHAEGLSVVHERGRLALVDRDSGEERAGISTPPPAQPLLARELADGPLRDALLAIVDVRALLGLVHVHSRIRALDVLDGERKTVVRMTLEEPAVVASSGRQVQLRPRVRLTGVRGYDDTLRSVRDKLEHELGFRAADQPLVDEAVRAAGGVPAGTSSKIHISLSPDQRADAATALVLRALLEVIEANLDGTVADIDSEFLHDFRVSVRRSRAVQRELKRVFPPDPLSSFRSEFRWLQQVTGDARDLDVYVLDFDSMRALIPQEIRADLEPLLAVLRSRRLSAKRDVARALRSDRTSQLLATWSEFLDELVELGTEDRPDASRRISEVAGSRIARVYRGMLRMGRAIDDSSPPADYHELRKKGKELRYLLELFGAPLHPGDVVKPMVRSLRALQDVLGRHQDREVQVAMLLSLRDEVSARPGGPSALMAMGVLVERLREDEQAMRAAFAERFALFSSKSERRLVKDTFT